MGAPYALSSDLVSAWPAKSLEMAQYIDGQVPLLAMTQNPQTGTTYSFVAADFTKLVTLSNASPVAVTLPLEATVPWPTGTQLRLLNQGAGTVTVAGAVGVTINGSPLTLTQYKGANLIKTGTNVWTFIPFASGVGAADFSNAATGTYSGYKYLTFTSSGTLTITTAGFADILVIGGGGGGGNLYGGGGGAGGYLDASSVYLPVGTLTVVVGAGGPGGVADTTFRPSGGNGVASRLDNFYGVGGGGGSGSEGGSGATAAGFTGGSGGGGGGGGTGTGGSATSNQGSAGGNGVASAGGGGGGKSAVGANGAGGPTGGNGGAGQASSITGSSVTRAGGGGGATQGGTAGSGGAGGGGAGTNTATTGTAGDANTGGGGGAGGWNGSASGAGGAGGSGIVIVRVAV